MFKNGGGAFLIPWLVCNIFVGFPLVLLEVAFGQHTGLTGPAAIGKAAPVLKGVGFSLLSMNLIMNVYMPAMIIAWAATFFFQSFLNLPSVPWSDYQETEWFWEKVVLDKSPEIGQGWDVLKWPQLVCLLTTWILVAILLCKGLPRVAKVLWITSAASCFLLFVLFIRAVSLPGAGTGLTYLFLPDWSKLGGYTAWVGALTHVVFNQGIGTMALITLGSLNKQQNNFIKDVAVVFGINTAIHLFSAILVFSTLGFVADMQGVVINDLVQSGLHMFFVLFPQAVSHMGLAPLWSALFFLMIILLGLGQQLVFLDSISLAIADNWPGLFGKDRLKLNIGLCLGMALLGFTICTKAGIHVLILLDIYPCGKLLLFWFLIFETIAIAWVFGGQRLWRSVHTHVSDMTGVDSLRIFWLFSTLILAPLALLASFLVVSVNFEDSWLDPGSRIVGNILQSLCNVWIVGYAIYFLIASGCSCRGACTPSQDERREREEEEEEEMEEMEKMEVDEDMVGMKSGVYPALP